mgnify:CR=1 FL=1
MQRLRRTIGITSLIIALLFVQLLPDRAHAEVMYNTFARDGFGQLIWDMQPSYIPTKIIGHDLVEPDPDDPEAMKPSPMRNPSDVYIDRHDHIYIADTGNNRIVHFDAEGRWIRYIQLEEDSFNSPQSVFVTDDGTIYVADTGNKRIVVLNADGTIRHLFDEPKSRFIPSDLVYDPIKVVVDQRGYIYVVTLGGYYGAIQLDPSGEFSKFYGMNKAPFSALDAFKRAVYSREMYANELSKLPPPISSIEIDRNGFIYTVTSGKDVTKDQVKKLNFEGKNILSAYNSLGEANDRYGEYLRAKRNEYPNLVDIAVDHEGNFTVIDRTFNYVSQYDANGDLLFFWGGQSANGITQLGLVKSPIALGINSQQDLFILDSQENVLQQFSLSEFGSLVYKANSLTLAGRYIESEAYWEQVLKLNAFYSPALNGLAKAAYQKGDYARAAALYRQAGNEKGYSESFWQIRLLWMQKHFPTFATIILIIAIVYFVAAKLLRRFAGERIEQLLAERKRKRKVRPLMEQLKHGWYILKHPIDGFTALRFEHKGSILSALIFYFLAYVAIVISKLYTSFSFNKIIVNQVNVIMILFQFCLIVGAWIICNYLISSIYRGEGRFRDVFIGTAYALIPLIVIGIPLAIVSNVLTLSEEPLYVYVKYAMYVWVGLMFIWKVQNLHNYSVGETMANIFLSICAIAILAVLSFIVIGLSNEIIIFLRELYLEVMLR